MRKDVIHKRNNRYVSKISHRFIINRATLFVRYIMLQNSKITRSMREDYNNSTFNSRRIGRMSREKRHRARFSLSSSANRKLCFYVFLLPTFKNIALVGQRAAESCDDKIALAIVRGAWECASFASLRNKGLKRATGLLTRTFPYVRQHVNYLMRTLLSNSRVSNEKVMVKRF